MMGPGSEVADAHALVHAFAHLAGELHTSDDHVNSLHGHSLDRNTEEPSTAGCSEQSDADEVMLSTSSSQNDDTRTKCAVPSGSWGSARSKPRGAAAGEGHPS